MIRIISIYIALFLSAIYTINAYWIGFNGQTTIESFNRLPVFISPANYVYIIWLIIFALIFVYLMSFKENKEPSLFQTNFQAALFACNAIVHILVIYIWHQGQYMSASILCGALLILMFSLYNTYPIHPKSLKLRIPIALLFSWLLFLFMLMLNITLIRYEWTGFGLSISLWTVIFLTCLTAISVYLRYQYDDVISPIIFIWIFIGITVENGFLNLLVSTAAVFLSGVLLFSLYVFKKNCEA